MRLKRQHKFYSSDKFRSTMRENERGSADEFDAENDEQNLKNGADKR
jgi:hypothetical protein